MLRLLTVYPIGYGRVVRRQSARRARLGLYERNLRTPGTRYLTTLWVKGERRRHGGRHQGIGCKVQACRNVQPAGRTVTPLTMGRRRSKCDGKTLRPHMKVRPGRVRSLNLSATAAELRRAAKVEADLILSDGSLSRGERLKRVQRNIVVILGRTPLTPPSRP